MFYLASLFVLHQTKLEAVVDLILAAGHGIVRFVLDPCIEDVIARFDISVGGGKGIRRGKN